MPTPKLSTSAQRAAYIKATLSMTPSLLQVLAEPLTKSSRTLVQDTRPGSLCRGVNIEVKGQLSAIITSSSPLTTLEKNYLAHLLPGYNMVDAGNRSANTLVGSNKHFMSSWVELAANTGRPKKEACLLYRGYYLGTIDPNTLAFSIKTSSYFMLYESTVAHTVAFRKTALLLESIISGNPFDPGTGEPKRIIYEF